ncbi:hypothetical protein EUGRSUZ_B02815 [Eucalyptus grandis]|uniref:Uncharacterized protein n=2 Tax=Eucalyptus grandis TaxID=71139 RepID=A0ACC3M1M3_EUCGR|nr:hypothetical protein EUGRSUZ_B02815 [Eucalyptus grandis]
MSPQIPAYFYPPDQRDGEASKGSSTQGDSPAFISIEQFKDLLKFMSYGILSQLLYFSRHGSCFYLP